MRSWWIRATSAGTELELRESERPVPKADEMLVRLHAAALNRGEFVAGPGLHAADGAFRPAGFEGAGVVEAVGPEVRDFQVGDRVMGRCEGAFAEYGIMVSGDALPVPGSMSLEKASAVVVTYLTAHDALIDQGRIRAGDRVLLIGAASGVGVASIQIAKARGATVLGTSGSAAKLEALCALGLDIPLHTRGEGLAEAVKEATRGQGVDIAVNMVGGTVFPEALRSLGFQGRMAMVGYVDQCVRAEIDLSLLHGMRLNVFGVSNKMRKPHHRFAAMAQLKQDLMADFEAGRLSPVIDAEFEFEALPQAKDHMESDSHIGKVVLRMAT